MSEAEKIRDLGAALGKAEGYLASLQRSDGHWCAELEGDSILESEYALLLYFLGQGDGPKFRRLANYVRSQQREDGGWTSFPGGPPVASVSVKAYFLLKLAGDDPRAPHMWRAREVIRRLGGLHACNSYTRVLLAIFGVYRWSRAPAIPPEIVLLPKWFYFNIYEMSAWSRAIVVPLAIVWAQKPSRSVPQECRLDELVVSPPPDPLAGAESRRERTWARFFLLVDRVLKLIEGLRLTPLRAKALRRSEEWVIERLAGSDGLGAIFPPIMNTVMAFVSRGRALDDPLVRSQLRELEKLEILEGDEIRLQPCFSPIWDTALAVNALLEAGRPDDDVDLRRAAEWLLSKEVRSVGDWKIKNPGGEPGGWCFEYANEFYPDCDDTAEVLAVLSRVRMGDADADARRRAALDRAAAWQLSMQSKNGGWGAFDKDCDHEIFEFVPFADHNAMLDPPTVDVTSRTVVALINVGIDDDDDAIRRALDFVRSEQEPDGSWYGRWGSNYLYGTWLALCAFRAAGNVPCETVSKGAGWLLSCQHEDGGWGESLSSYDDPSAKGRGPSTAAQTAWALLGLLAAGAFEDSRGREALRRGAAYLVSSQGEDGSWHDEHWTATGFPKVFYLRYHYYACYFPLEALATYSRAFEVYLKKRQAA